eukprot:8432923-Pyramimonas_sp.AAC.2
MAHLARKVAQRVPLGAVFLSCAHDVTEPRDSQVRNTAMGFNQGLPYSLCAATYYGEDTDLAVWEMGPMGNSDPMGFEDELAMRNFFSPEMYVTSFPAHHRRPTPLAALAESDEGPPLRGGPPLKRGGRARAPRSESAPGEKTAPCLGVGVHAVGVGVHAVGVGAHAVGVGFHAREVGVRAAGVGFDVVGVGLTL